MCRDVGKIFVKNVSETGTGKKIKNSVKHRLFDYGTFFKELKNDPDKRENALRYENTFGPQENLTIEDQAFYKYYLSLFSLPFPLAIPKDCPNKYDRDLFVRLVLGSLTTDYAFILDEEWKKHPKGTPIVHLAIYASNERGILDELLDIQVWNVIETYSSEQMLLSLTLEDELDRNKKEEWRWSIAVVLEHQKFVCKCKTSLILDEINSVRRKNAANCTKGEKRNTRQKGV